jgi:hypothetical protein
VQAPARTNQQRAAKPQAIAEGKYVFGRFKRVQIGRFGVCVDVKPKRANSFDFALRSPPSHIASATVVNSATKPIQRHNRVGQFIARLIKILAGFLLWQYVHEAFQPALGQDRLQKS